jgi:hypothetical protein
MYYVLQQDGKMKVVRCEMKDEGGKSTKLFFVCLASLKTLYYYWLLIFYFNIVHSLWTNTNTNKKSGFTFWHVHIILIHLLVFYCDAVRFGSVQSDIPDHT